MKNMNIRRTVVASVFAAVVFVITFIIKIPTPTGGYVNLGDAAVLLAGLMLSPAYAFVAAGVGSALADLILGYAIYIPATFVIKGGVALIICLGVTLLSKRIGKYPCLLIFGALAEIFMAGAYLLFEGFIYGFAPSLLNVPANLAQGAVGLVLCVVIFTVLDKSKIKFPKF